MAVIVVGDFGTDHGTEQGPDRRAAITADLVADRAARGAADDRTDDLVMAGHGRRAGADAQNRNQQQSGLFHVTHAPRGCQIDASHAIARV